MHKKSPHGLVYSPTVLILALSSLLLLVQPCHSPSPPNGFPHLHLFYLHFPTSTTSLPCIRPRLSCSLLLLLSSSSTFQPTSEADHWPGRLESLVPGFPLEDRNNSIVARQCNPRPTHGGHFLRSFFSVTNDPIIEPRPLFGFPPLTSNDTLILSRD